MKKIQRAVFDTSAMFAAVVRNDAHHVPARETFARTTECLLPTTVVTELAYLFWKHGISADVLEAVLNNPKTKIICDETAQKKAISEVGERGISLLRINDIATIQTAKAINVPLVSFDRQLREEAKKKGITVYPVEP